MSFLQDLYCCNCNNLNCTWPVCSFQCVYYTHTCHVYAEQIASWRPDWTTAPSFAVLIARGWFVRSSVRRTDGFKQSRLHYHTIQDWPRCWSMPAREQARGFGIDTVKSQTFFAWRTIGQFWRFHIHLIGALLQGWITGFILTFVTIDKTQVLSDVWIVLDGAGFHPIGVTFRFVVLTN